MVEAFQSLVERIQIGLKEKRYLRHLQSIEIIYRCIELYCIERSIVEKLMNQGRYEIG